MVSLKSASQGKVRSAYHERCGLHKMLILVNCAVLDLGPSRTIGQSLKMQSHKIQKLCPMQLGDEQNAEAKAADPYRKAAQAAAGSSDETTLSTSSLADEGILRQRPYFITTMVSLYSRFASSIVADLSNLIDNASFILQKVLAVL